jgi:hypothetical protein
MRYRDAENKKSRVASMNLAFRCGYRYAPAPTFLDGGACMPNDKFHQRFNIDLGIDEAKRRFVNRAHTIIVHEVWQRLARPADLTHAMDFDMFICKKLGEEFKGCGCLSSTLGKDFTMHVRALEAMYEYPDTKDWADRAAKELMSESELDLGIQWQEGKFHPSGSPLLDDMLVNDVLILLKNFSHKTVLDPFINGLDHFLHSLGNPALLSDVVTNMHKALEASAKIVNENDKDLYANCEAFVSNLKLSDHYKRMLKEYIRYANDIARHATKREQPKAEPCRREVEAFIYQTGIFLRLAHTEET